MTISSYIAQAMSRARYKLLDDGVYFGEIAGFRGVDWANDKNLEACRSKLQEVLEEWIVLHLRERQKLPPIHGKTLSIPHPARA